MGFARRPITPGGPCQMAGYGAFRRSQGVYDELYARALALRGGSMTVVILQLDVLCVDELFMRRIEPYLDEMGLPGDRLLVCCSHTHSSFGGIVDVTGGLNAQLKDLLGEENPALLNMLALQSADAIREAMSDMRSVGVRILRDTAEGVATNRHSAEDPCDSDLFVADFLRDDGRRAVIYNLCCHPTVLGMNNLMLSADFPGYANQYLENHCDMPVFINGSAGDMSTRFTRRGSTLSECRRIGELAGTKVAEMLKAPDEYAPADSVSLVHHTIYMKRAIYDSPVAAERKLESARENLRAVAAATDDPSLIRKAQSVVEGATINMLKSRLAQEGCLPDIPVKTGILSLNGTRIVCSPFELFSTLAIKLKDKAGVEMFGYTNVYQGYLADCAAYDNMEYEALFSDYAAGEGEAYIGKVLEILKSESEESNNGRSE